MRILVVGAGLAGLTAARALNDAHDVLVIDKGRGVGGRMATRRMGDATLDHGAQFFTTHTDEFAAVVADWQAAGVARPWFRGRLGPTGIVAADGHTRFRGVDSMNAVAKHLATGLDVRTSTAATSISHADGSDVWVITIGNRSLQAEALVLTPPVPQSLALLADGEVVLAPDDLAALTAVRYEPCLALLAVLDGPSGLPEPGAVDPENGPIDWMADNQRKGLSASPAVTIHATADFSREHWSAPDEVVVAALLAAAGLPAAPSAAQVQRWRYARPVGVHPARHLLAQGLPPLVFAGDAFGGAKVEGAVLSGRSAAAALDPALAETVDTVEFARDPT